MFLKQLKVPIGVLLFTACTVSSSLALAGPRNAPAAALDPAADITDLYAFRSWQDPSKVVFILNVLGGQNPGDGPLYYNFSDGVKYRINIDNDMDGIADDVVYEISFKTEERPAFGELVFPLSYVGNPLIQSRPELRGISSLDGPGSEGITLRQIYKVKEISKKKYPVDLFPEKKLIAVPSNVGPVTMPNYEMLAAQGIFDNDNLAIKVFAGQRADVFYADTGALFDGAAPRRFPPLLSPEEEASNTINPFGINNFRGRNVHSIVLEVPISMITADDSSAEETDQPYIGIYASASRLMKNGARSNKKQYRQVSRMGNSMVQSLIIDTFSKNKYAKSKPSRDKQFADIFSDPPLARAPTSEIFGVPVPSAPRVDLLSLFLKYPGQSVEDGECGNPCAELLRLDVSVNPTEPEDQQRMGSVMGTDPAGMPNGRRPGDDPVDFTVRAIGGPPLIFARLGDGVNFADGISGAGIIDGRGYGEIPGNHLDVLENGIVKEFPYMPTPRSGR